jgi:hypothetical protein
MTTSARQRTLEWLEQIRSWVNDQQLAELRTLIDAERDEQAQMEALRRGTYVLTPRVPIERVRELLGLADGSIKSTGETKWLQGNELRVLLQEVLDARGGGAAGGGGGG